MSLNPNRIRILVSGAGGKMGKQVCDAVSGASDMELVGAVDPAFAEIELSSIVGTIETDVVVSGGLESVEEGFADVMIDFTAPISAAENVIKAMEKGMHVVCGTTGMSKAQTEEIERKSNQSGKNVLIAPNFAIGAVLMMMVSEKIAGFMKNCEIVEIHHENKIDSPSGTALLTAEKIGSKLDGVSDGGFEGEPARGLLHEKVPIHSIRLPGAVAHQMVIFGGLAQTLTIRHDSIGRESFMPGVLMAVREVIARKGLTYGLDKLMQF